MYRIILIILIILFFNCTLTEPCTLIIENESDYTITVSVSNGDKSEIILNKGKGDFVLVSPGQIELTVNIESIKFIKKYTITMNYQEKKKFIFDIHK